MIRSLIRLIGILLALPILGLFALALFTPITGWGIAYLAALGLLAFGLIAVPRWRRGSSTIIAIAMMSLIAIPSIRWVSIMQQAWEPVRIVTLPNGRAVRWIDTIIPEQDTILFGETFMRLLGGVSAREHESLAPAMVAAYAEMDGEAGLTASPVISTYVGLQRPSAFDLVLIEPESEAPQTGVIFLHGFMGNITLQCWQLAQAVQTINAVTACPSTGWIGDWWSPQGEAEIRATFEYLHGLGIERIYLGGFSNGGGGLGRLIANLKDEPGLKGIFFIAGVRNSEAVAEAGLPVLVIQGRDDERMPVEAARQFVDDVGELATYVELEADHFLIVKQAAQVQAALADWLQQQEAVS
jgi:pimeloyl-ACP methyl ester carboxylesterase